MLVLVIYLPLSVFLAIGFIRYHLAVGMAQHEFV